MLTGEQNHVKLDPAGVNPGFASTLQEQNVTPVEVETENFTYAATHDSPEGILMRKVVPSDNSCLFNSILFCLNDGTLKTVGL